jgi:drug/metabolite transporter (DMT)-like permease
MTSFSADLVLLAITAIWGATFVTVKGGLTDADAFTFLTLRFALGAVVAAALAHRRLASSSVWRRGSILGVLLFGGYAFQTLGLEHTTPERSAFITGLTVAFVPFAGFLLFRKRPELVALAGSALALAGLFTLTGFDVRSVLPVGDLFTLGCAVVYAFHIVLTGHFSSGVSAIALVAVQLLVTALLSAVAMLFGVVRLNPTADLLVAVVLTGILASVLAISLQVWAQSRTSAVRAAVIFSLEPAFAVAYAAVLGQVTISRRELLGGAIMVLGVLVAEIGAAVLQKRREVRVT